MPRGNFGHAGRPGLVGGSQSKSNLSQLFLMLKGSSRSGNFGHAGRKGKRGGSSKSSSFSKVPEPNEPEFLNAEYKKVSKEAYNYNDTNSGLASRIEIASGRRLVGGIYNKEGERVGEFIREFSFSGDSVSHLGFKLDDEYQKAGFGARFYKHSEDAYLKNGIKEVNLEANMTVGGYAWARMGFGFTHDSEAGGMVAQLTRKYMKEYGVKGLEKIEFPDTPWGIAAFAGPDGKRIGKDLLLGSKWSATKKLDSDDIGYQVGEIYYKEKGL